VPQEHGVHFQPDVAITRDSRCGERGASEDQLALNGGRQRVRVCPLGEGKTGSYRKYHERHERHVSRCHMQATTLGDRCQNIVYQVELCKVQGRRDTSQR
jgi:hypothetical protein